MFYWTMEFLSDPDSISFVLEIFSTTYRAVGRSKNWILGLMKKKVLLLFLLKGGGGERLCPLFRRSWDKEKMKNVQ